MIDFHVRLISEVIAEREINVANGIFLCAVFTEQENVWQVIIAFIYTMNLLKIILQL